MRIAKMISALLIVTLAVSATDALAEDQIYRWVDENGVVHFGDQKPSNIEAEKVMVEKSTSTAVTSPSETNSPYDSPTLEPEPSAVQKIRDERAKKRAEAAERERVIAEACAQRRTIVSQLEPSTRVMVRLEDGTVSRMDDNVRLETLNEAKSYIAQNCEK